MDTRIILLDRDNDSFLRTRTSRMCVFGELMPSSDCASRESRPRYYEFMIHWLMSSSDVTETIQYTIYYKISLFFYFISYNFVCRLILITREHAAAEEKKRIFLVGVMRHSSTLMCGRRGASITIMVHTTEFRGRIFREFTASRIRRTEVISLLYF